MTSKKPTTRPLKADPKRQATDPLRGYVYQIWHSVNAWLELGDDEVLYLEGAEDFDKVSIDTATTTQVKDTQRTITLRSPEVNEAIDHFWDLSSNHPDLCVKFRFLTRSKIGREQGSPFGKGRAGLQIWSRCSVDEEAISKISNFLQSEGRISEEIAKFLQGASPQRIHEQLIDPISWETESKQASYVEESINEKLVLHGNRYKIPPSDAKNVLGHLLNEAFKVATKKNNRELTRARFLEIFEASTTIRVPLGHVRQQLQAEPTIMDTFGSEFIGRPSDVFIQFQSSILNHIPPLYDDAAPRTGLVYTARTKLQSDGFAVIRGGTGIGKTTLAKLTANALGGTWFWLNFTDKDQTQVLGLLRQLSVAVRNQSERANIVLDDLNLEPREARKYEEALGVVVYELLERGGKLLIASQVKPPNNLIRRLGVPPSALINVPNFTIVEIGQFAQQMGCPVNCAKTLAKLTLLHTSGHPRLVHARLARLRSEGWKHVINESILQTPPELLEEREEARQLLLELPKDQRELLYRLSLMSSPFTRELAVNIAEIPESIPHPGDIFSQLVGPWIDSVSDAYYGISPLLNNAANQVWSGQKTTKLRGQIAHAVLETRTLTKIDAQTVLINGLVGQNETALVAVIHALDAVPMKNWKRLSQDFSWLLAVCTNPRKELLPGKDYVNHIFRSLQYRIASEVEPEFAPKILEIWEKEIKHEAHDSYLMSRIRLTTQALVNFQVPLPPKQLVSYLAEMIEIENKHKDTKEIKEAFHALRRQFRCHLTDKADLFRNLFRLVAARRPCNAPFFSDLIDALDELQPKIRTLLLADFNDSTDSRILVDSVWVSEAESKDPNWTRCLEALERAIDRLIAWELPHFASTVARGKAVIYERYLHDTETAHEVVLNMIARVGPTPVLEATQAAIFLHHKHYRKALDIYERILPKWDPSSEFDIGPLDGCRGAGMCAAYLHEWEKSASFFVDGAEKAREINDNKRCIGMYADAGFAQFKAGNISSSLELLILALREFDKIPQNDTEVGFFTLKKVLGYSIAYLAQSTDTIEIVEPPPGFCSNTDRDDEILKYPNYPIQYAWLHLAQLEYRFDLGAEILEQARCLKDRRLFPFLNLSLSMLEVQYDYKCRAFGNLPHRMDQLAYAYVTTMKHEQSGKGVEETGTYTVEIADLDKFASVETLTAMFVTALLVRLPENSDINEILTMWRMSAVELSTKGNMTATFDLIESMLSRENEHAPRVMRKRDATSELRLAAAFSLIRNNAEPDDLFYAQTLLSFFISDIERVWNWEESLFMDLAELFASQWLQKIEFQALLKTPTITVPQIKEACNSSETGKKKIGRMLLAVEPAVSTHLPHDFLQLIRSWID